VEDQETNNNTDKSVNVNVETNIESGTDYFSSVQEPSENTSVYGLSDKFALAIFQHSAPTLSAYGGTYATLRRWTSKIFYHLLFSFWYWWPKDETKSENLLWALHSVIHEAFLAAIHGRSNNFSDGSHLQQANVI
jgi:hypothetical protein